MIRYGKRLKFITRKTIFCAGFVGFYKDTLGYLPVIEFTERRITAYFLLAADRSVVSVAGYV